MRPAQYYAGFDNREVALARRVLASMRPAQYYAGFGISWDLLGCSASCFNEAGAILRRIFHIGRKTEAVSFPLQ